MNHRLVNTAFLLITLSIATTSCVRASSPTALEQSDKSRMLENVELSIVKKIKPSARLPEGDNLENNAYTRYLTEKSGVSFRVLWAAAEQDYEDKLKLAVATNDIPDVTIVNETLFRELVKSDQIMDLTEVFQSYASPLLKEFYESSHNKALKKATIEGKLMAIPNMSIQGDAFSMLWIREDWLRRLELQPPRTVEDVEVIARAFVERDPDGDGIANTLGIAGNAEHIASRSGVADFTGWFAAYQAFPGIWLQDDSGHVVYGSTTSEAKEALGKLRQLYKDGLIDPDFYLRQEVSSPIASGESGMFFAPWFAPWYPLNESILNDREAVWRPYPIYSPDNKLYSRSMPVSEWFIVVRKDVEHPEALIMYINHYLNIQRYRDPDAKKLDLTLDASFYPIYTSFDYADAATRKHEALMDVIEGRTGPDKLDPEMRQHYEAWQRVVASPEFFTIGDWMAPYAYMYGASVLNQDIHYVDNVFTAMTRTMKSKWDKLQRIEIEAYLSIIAGERPLSHFDEFVRQWNEEGGAAIIAEIEAELKMMR